MKKFLIQLSYTVFPLWLFWVGLTVYYNLLIMPNIHGDLSRLSKTPMPEYIQSPNDTMLFLSTTNQRIIRDTLVDVLTIGDSFSQQGKDGYQNYMALKGVKVINFNNRSSQKYQMLYDLFNLGFIDSTNVKTVIVECVERDLVWSLQTIRQDHDSIVPFHNHPSKSEPKWSLLEAKNYLMLRLGFKNPVRHVMMSRTLFSNDNRNELYFYEEDLNSYHIEDKSKKAIVRNISLLKHKADSVGVGLIFLVCPDKYDVYQQYIIDNPYSRKTINEDFKELFPYPENLLMAKDLIMPYINKGGLDYYHFNDTHWSHKSAMVVADGLMRMCKQNRQR